MLLSQEQAPAEVSCRPQLSAVTRSMTRPSLDMSLVPARHRPSPARAACPARCSVRQVVGAVEQRIDRLLAVGVDDAQRLPLADRSRDHGLRAGISISSMMRAAAGTINRHRAPSAGLAEIGDIVLESTRRFRARRPAQIVGSGDAGAE